MKNTKCQKDLKLSKLYFSFILPNHNLNLRGLRAHLLTLRGPAVCPSTFRYFLYNPRLWITFDFWTFWFLTFHFLTSYFLTFHFLTFNFLTFHFLTFHFLTFHFSTFHYSPIFFGLFYVLWFVVQIACILRDAFSFAIWSWSSSAFSSLTKSNFFSPTTWDKIWSKGPELNDQN